MHAFQCERNYFKGITQFKCLTHIHTTAKKKPPPMTYEKQKK